MELPSVHLWCLTLQEASLGEAGWSLRWLCAPWLQAEVPGGDMQLWQEPGEQSAQVLWCHWESLAWQLWKLHRLKRVIAFHVTLSWPRAW